MLGKEGLTYKKPPLNIVRFETYSKGLFKTAENTLTPTPEIAHKVL